VTFLTHLDLGSDGYGGERQTALLVRGLAEHGIAQRLVTSSAALHEALADVPALDRVRVGGAATALPACLTRSSLLHAHGGVAAGVALLRRFLGGPPYVVTRRVTALPDPGPFTRRVHRRASRLVATSQPVVDALQRFDSTLTPVMIPGAVAPVPRDRRREAALRAEAGDRVLVGCLPTAAEDSAGPALLRDVARRLAGAAPDIRFLVGHGAVHGAAGEGGITARLESVEDPASVLGAFDILLCPTPADGFDTIVLDALDAGVPVIAGRGGALPELVPPEAGILVRDGARDEVAAAVLRLATDTPRRREMARAARAHASRYTARRLVSSYLRLYGSLGILRAGTSSARGSL
jgi:glycosyltransferase involved in cell wall biosynthesis